MTGSIVQESTVFVTSIDIETTGHIPAKHQILEIGAMIWDTTTDVFLKDAFECCVLHEDLIGTPTALQMNAALLRKISEKKPQYCFLKPEHVAKRFAEWYRDATGEPGRPRIWPAGFNFDSFDRQFLERLPDWSNHVQLRHRSISPATLYFDPRTDNAIPSSDEVFRRADITVENRHTALADAWATLMAIRNKYHAPDR
jgi:oligoribonuclease